MSALVLALRPRFLLAGSRILRTSRSSSILLQQATCTPSTGTYFQRGLGLGVGLRLRLRLLGLRRFEKFRCCSSAADGYEGTINGKEASLANLSLITEDNVFMREEDIRHFINAFDEDIDAKDMAYVLYNMSKQKITLSDEIMAYSVNVFKYKTMKVDIYHTTRCFEGLHCFRDDADVNIKAEYLIYLREILDLKPIQVTFTGHAIGQCLYALKNIPNNQLGVDSLLRKLTLNIASSRQYITAHSISNALYGLQNMSSRKPDVRELVVALTAKVIDSPEVLSAQGVGNSLYGLKNMSSKEVEVRGLLSALSYKIIQSSADDKLSGQELSNG